MGGAAKPELQFGMAADVLRALCRKDPVLHELVSDYETLSCELRVNQVGRKDTDVRFWSDTLETLHALNGEIQDRLSRLEHSAQTKGK